MKFAEGILDNRVNAPNHKLVKPELTRDELSELVYALEDATSWTLLRVQASPCGEAQSEGDRARLKRWLKSLVRYRRLKAKLVLAEAAEIEPDSPGNKIDDFIEHHIQREMPVEASR